MMNSTFRIALIPLFICLAAVLSAGGKKEVEVKNIPVPAEETGVVVRVSGTVRLVGSEPFTELVITGPDREWYIDSNDAPKLRNLQHRTVVVEGIETVKTLTFANGLPAGERRTLKNISIISVQ